MKLTYINGSSAGIGVDDGWRYSEFSLIFQENYYIVSVERHIDMGYRFHVTYYDWQKTNLMYSLQPTYSSWFADEIKVEDVVSFIAASKTKFIVREIEQCAVDRFYTADINLEVN